MTTAAAPNATDHIPREAWLALIIATLVFFLVVVDVSAVNVAFPSIGRDFEVDETTLGWILSGYNITVAALLMVSGRLADSLGRKKMFMPGVAIFGLGSLLCGLAPNTNVLILARVVQAIGGAIVSPTAIAVVLPEFPVAKRSMAIGITGATAGLGGVFGPAVGSLLIDVWSWRGIFFINVPLCLVVLVLSPRLLRESKNPAATGKIDLLGVAIGTAAVFLVMFAIVQSETRGIGDVRVLAMFVVGLALVPVLIRRSSRHPEPLIELNLFRKRSFSSTNAGLAFYSMAFTSGFLVNSLVLQDLWDQSITTTGKALVFSAGTSAVLSPIAGRMADRIGHRWILMAGSLCCGTAFLLFQLLLDAEPHVFDRYVPISLLLGFGVGTSISTWSSAGLSDVDPAQFGTANASIRTTQQVFYALGISVVITLLASRSGIGGFRLAWGWVTAMYYLSAAVIAFGFPAGTSAGRGQVTS
ncbi:MAG: MFS transporter [Acidimicrobiales bacterium]